MDCRTRFPQGLDTGADAEAQVRQRVEDNAERFARALTSTLLESALPRQAAGVDGLTGPGCQSDTNLTGGAAPTSAARAELAGVHGSEGGDSDLQSLALRVNAGDLGEITVVVDRINSSTRVSIGVADARAERALGTERGLLEHALREAGVRVNSIVVVRTALVGTAFANELRNGTRSKDTRRHSEEQGDERPKQRLKLIG